jgi:hypothetical protein
MGVLDDAIREHLELKRQHGAEEAELRRQAEEALGPARRAVAPEDAEEDGAAVDAEGDEPAEAAVAQDELAVPEAEPEAPAADVAAERLQQPTEEHAPFDDEAPRGETPQRGFEELDDEELEGEELDEDEPEDEPLDEDEPPLEEEPFAEGGDARDGEDAESEDVLEDTPDFLEDTPEHDRLWFEQKPPRDFDFD